MLSAALLAAIPGTALAVDVDYQVGASVLRSDNIALSEADPTSETVLSPQFRFEAEQNSSTLQMLARGNVEYLHYAEGSFDDEVRGELAATLNWTILPKRLDFVVRDYLNREPINVLTGFSPGNQQEVNVFIAGPTFYSRFSESTLGQLDLRYGNSYAEENKNFDGDRYNAAARVLRDIDAVSTISINAEATKVDYDEAGSSTDYTRYDAYIGYTRTLASVDLGIDLGYAQVRLRGSEHESEPTARLDLGWRVTPRSEIDASLDYEFGDAAQNTITRADIPGGSIINDFSNADVVIGPGVFRLRRIDLGYKFQGERTDLQLRPYYQRFEYLDDTNPDQISHGGALEVGYLLRPLTRLSLLAAHERREFDQLSREDKDLAIYLSLVNQITRHWSWQVDLQHRERDSTDAGMSYDENAIIFAVNYRR